MNCLTDSYIAFLPHFMGVNKFWEDPCVQGINCLLVAGAIEAPIFSFWFDKLKFG